MAFIKEIVKMIQKIHNLPSLLLTSKIAPNMVIFAGHITMPTYEQ